MKIMHVMAGGQAGGAEMAYVDLLIAQKQAGMDVIAACRPNTQRIKLLEAVGIPVFPFPFGGIFDWRTKPRLKKLIRQEMPDIVQCWMSRASKHTPNPAPDLPPFQKIARLGGYYNLKYYKGVQHFIGNTPDICRWLIEDQKIPASQVTHINNFAELEPVTDPLFKRDCDTQENDFVFLAMARLHQVKGLDTAIKALSHIPKGIIWIAGEGPEEKSLKSLAKEWRVEDRIRWLGWRTDRAALLQASDAVVFSSRFEPFGGTFAQAWAAKKPLITTASAGPMQYVTDGHDARVVPIDDDQALARAMQSVMDDKHLQRALARHGYDSFQNHFTQKKVLRDYEMLYQGLKNNKDDESLSPALCHDRT